MGAVSPATLPILRMIPVIMPGIAAGKTTCFIVCHLLTPRAREDSLYSFGTASKSFFTGTNNYRKNKKRKCKRS